MAKEQTADETPSETSSTGYRKRFEDLTFADDYIFKLVMERSDVFEAFLKVIMPQLEVERLVSLETEKPFTVNYFFHGARFDVLAKVKGKSDSDKKFINMEMQICDEGETPERSLYYLALLIIMSLKKGESYKTIADCCVIFFCKFDPLKKGLPVYTFDMKCEEKTDGDDVSLGKEVRIILFNAPAYEKCKEGELKALLKFVMTNEAESQAARMAASALDCIKRDPKMQGGYSMLGEQLIKERNEGRKEGRKEGALKTLYELVKKKLLSLSTAATEAGQSEEEFKSGMESYFLRTGATK